MSREGCRKHGGHGQFEAQPTSSSRPSVPLSRPQGGGSPLSLSAHIPFTVTGMLQGDLEGGSGWEGDALFWGKVSPRLSRNLGTIPEVPQGFGSWQKINAGHFQDPRHVCPCEERWMARAGGFSS